jgi:hypothetical protein
VGQPQKFEKLRDTTEGREDEWPGRWCRRAMEHKVTLVPELRAPEDDMFC